MQPTNSDIDYEKALQNYFHYDMDRVRADAHTLRQASKHTQLDEYVLIVHKFIYRMVTGEKYAGDNTGYHTGTGSYGMSDSIRCFKPALRLQEYIHDWNDVVEMNERPPRRIDEIDKDMHMVTRAIDKTVDEIIRDLDTRDEWVHNGVNTRNVIGIHQNIQLMQGRR